MRKLASLWGGLVVVLAALAATVLVATGASASTATPGPAGVPPAPAVSASPTAGPAASVPPDQGVRVFVRESREGVGDVRVTVSRDGTDVGTGTTDERGTVVIGVPAAGEYTVTVDAKSLPEGKALDTASITRQVRPGDVVPVAFRVGAPGAGEKSSGEGRFGLAMQLFAQGLRFGLIVALAAIGLSLIFGTTGLTNFAHGELVTFGALVAYFFNVAVGLPLVLAALVTLVVCGAAGWAQDRGLWGPLRRRGTGLIAMMIVSIGLALLLRYLFLMRFGGNTQSFADYQGQAGIPIGPVLLRPADLWSMGIAAVVLVAVSIALLRTKLGKATRAVADNPALAAASGIDVDKVIRAVWISGTALAGLAGILLGLAQGINYQMGLQILLLVFAAVTLGGLGTAFGALAGSIIVGVLIEVSTLWVPTELKNVGALAVLIIILLVRPQGLLGRRERIG